MDKVERYRIVDGFYGTKYGQKFGAFSVPSPFEDGCNILVICSPLELEFEWWHVSASLPDRCPTWNEMCHIKALFLDDLPAVQYHPSSSNYVNIHNNCLHLWHNTKHDFMFPPKEMV